MSSKKYYDYLKKYDTHFLNKYENWSHFNWGRKSNFLQLLYTKSYLTYNGRNIFMHGYKFKSWFVWVGSVVCVTDIYLIWIYQEMYNKLYPWKWTLYMPYYRSECMFNE